MKFTPPLFRFLALWISSLAVSCSSDTLTLVENGTSKFEIVIADRKTPHEKAAKELQKYIEQITGVRLPIVTEPSTTHRIHVGSTSLALAKDETAILSNDQGVTVAGGDPMSTLYATYTFLEEYLGCRFYAPDHEAIPRTGTLEVPTGLDQRYQPDITVRTVHSRLFYQDSAFADKRKVTYEAFPKYVPEARVHTFHRFIPAEKHLDKHPEYYAFRDGRRIPTQLCLTNEDVYRIVKDTVASLLMRYPEAEVISVSQDDNQQYCQCDNCAAIDKAEESPAGSMIAFVNRIAEAFPDKMISTLAYQYTRKAPRNLIPRENVLITLCSIECDRSGPIAEKCEDFYQDLVDWGKISDNVRIWDYTTQFTNFLAPFPNLRTLQPNVQLFRDNSARWVFEQHSHNPSELFELRSYLTAKLLWNPDLDWQSEMKDFLYGYYEEAAPFIHQYIETVHDELEADSSFFLFLYGDPSQGFDSFLSPELLTRYNQWFDEAEAAVSSQPEVLARVRRVRLSVDYASLEAARKNLSKEFALSETQVDGSIGTPTDLTERLRRFENTCREGHITAMNEMRFTVEEYLEGYEATLKRAVEPNLAKGKPVNLQSEATKYANEDPQTLTDGAFGGASFYANWLGFVGNDAIAVIDLEETQTISAIRSTFLQVVNHIVFFPESVTYEYSLNGKDFVALGTVKNSQPLNPSSKINDTQNFDLNFEPIKARFVKIIGKNMDKAPIWHHGAGLPTWVFVDEVIVQ